MKIERISKTKRGRNALFGEDGFLFSVDDETLAKSGVGEGSSVTDGELSVLREGSDLRKAKDQALRYLSLRAYAEGELYRKICLKYDEHTAAVAVADMKEIGLLDDTAYAAEKARGMKERGKSAAEIRRTLTAAGVLDGDCARAVAAAEVDDEAAALRLVRKMYMEKLARGERQKVMAALARRGFNHRDICAAVEMAQAELPQESDWEKA